MISHSHTVLSHPHPRTHRPQGPHNMRVSHSYTSFPHTPIPIPSQYYILTPHFLTILYPHTMFPHNIISSQPESEYGVKYFAEQTQSVPSEASLTKSNLFSLFIGLAIRVLILFYYAQAFYCSGLKRVLSCHVLASLFPRTKSRYINLFVYDYTIIVWDH